MPIGAGSLSEDRSAKAVKKLNILKKRAKILIRSISFFKTTVLLIHARLPRDKISSLSEPSGDASSPKQVWCARAEVHYITDMHQVVKRRGSD